MYQHYNYGIILIQKSASVHPLTFREDPDRIKKMWEAEELAKKALYKTEKKGGSKAKQSIDGDEEMADSTKFAKHTARKHQNMFRGGNGALHLNYYDEEEEDEDDEESEDEDDIHQENVFNQ